MDSDLLLRYANQSYSPSNRARDFLLRDPRFSWANNLLEENKRSDILLAGSSLRDVLMGHVPAHPSITVTGLSPKNIRQALTPTGNLDLEGGEHAMTYRPKSAPHENLYILVNHLPPTDFTFDAPLYSLREESLADNQNGLADLHAGVIRVPGYPLRTFAEDPLRMLRTLRLAASHGLHIAAETWHALQCSLPRLNKISRNDAGKAEFTHPRQVIGSSFLDTLLHHPTYGSSLIGDSGFGHLVAPELSHGAWAQGEAALDTLTHKDTLGHFKLATISAAAIVAALFMYHERNSKLAADFLKKFHLGHLTKDVSWLLANLDHFHTHDPASMSPSAFEKHFASERGRNLLALMHAKFLHDGSHHIARERLHVARRLLDALHAKTALLPKLIRGRDLSILGVTPGPFYRDLMKKVRDSQLAGKLQNRDDALSFLQLHISKI